DADAGTKILWSGPNHGRIRVDLTRPQVLSVQISFDRGWRTSANGVDFAPQRDALGFLVLEPDCHGLCPVALTHEGGMQATLMRLLCVLGFVACGWIIFRERHSQPRG